MILRYTTEINFEQSEDKWDVFRFKEASLCIICDSTGFFHGAILSPFWVFQKLVFVGANKLPKKVNKLYS